MSSNSNEAADKLKAIFETWKDQHSQLDAHTLDLIRWMKQDSKREVPPFQQAVGHLRELDSRLRQHFVNEMAIGQLLGNASGTASNEVAAAQRQADKDHQVLSEMLTELIKTFDCGDGQWSSWNAAVNEFDLFIDLLEMHEEQENDNVNCLLPYNRSD